MSDAFECDRCGVLAKGDPALVECHSAPSERGGLYEATELGDLCPDCANALVRFMDNERGAPPLLTTLNR